MNDLLLSLAMAALGQLGGPGLGNQGFGGPGFGAQGLGGLIPGLARPGRIGLMPGPYGINGGFPGQGYPGSGYPGSGYPGNGYPGRAIPPAGLVPRPGGVNGSAPSPSLQLATASAARCLESSGGLPTADQQDLLRHQGRLWGWTDGWQNSISKVQSDRLIARHGGCTPFLNALRDGSLRQGRGPLPTTIGQRPLGGSLPAPQRPSGRAPSSEAEAFGLAPYR